jgi:NADPH2:quinone reductase
VNGEGVDLILEMLANVNLNTDLQLLKSHTGRVVVIGNRGTVDINPRLLMAKETSICGVMLHSSSPVRRSNFIAERILFCLKQG